MRGRVWVASKGVAGVLGDAVTGDARDAATGDPIGDDRGIREGGDGVACGHGSSGPNIEGLRMRLRRMGFGFAVIFGSSFSFGLSLAFGTDTGKAGVESETVVAAVSTLAVENSLSLSDELEEAWGSEKALRPDSRFLAKSLCTDDVVVICVDAEIGSVCRACGSEDTVSDHEGSLVRGFFARWERAFSSSSEETDKEGMCPLRNLGCLTGVAALTAVVGSTRGLDGGVLGGEITDKAGTLDFVYGVLTFFVDGVLGVAGCVGTFLTFTPTIAASGYPPLRRNSAVLNRFSPSPSGSTRMSQELARVNVDDLRREDGRRGADVETGVPKVEFEFEDAVDFRILLWEALSVDELGVEGARECSIGRRK